MTDDLTGYTSRQNLCANGFRDEFLTKLFGPPTPINGVDYWQTQNVEHIEQTVIAPAVRTAYRVDAHRLYGDHSKSYLAVLDGVEKFVQE